jgi:hypothetical protein
MLVSNSTKSPSLTYLSWQMHNPVGCMVNYTKKIKLPVVTEPEGSSPCSQKPSMDPTFQLTSLSHILGGTTVKHLILSPGHKFLPSETDILKGSTGISANLFV